MMSGEDRDANQAAAFAEWQAERRALALRRWCEQIPEDQRDEYPLDPRVADWVKRFVAGAPENLAMLGYLGTTKTWHAWHAVRHAYLSGWLGTAKFYSAYAWKRVIGPPLNLDEIASAISVDVLILDDVGATRLGEWEQEHLYGVVDERRNNRRPTILTSNASSFDKLFAPRITSRLAGRTTVVTLTGPDRRRSQ